MYKNYGNGSKIDEKATENAPKQINEYLPIGIGRK